MIRFVCPACQSAIRAGDHQTDRTVRCPKCAQLVIVPPSLGIPLTENPPPVRPAPACEHSLGERPMPGPVPETATTNFFGPEFEGAPDSRPLSGPGRTLMISLSLAIAVTAVALAAVVWARSRQRESAKSSVT